MNYQHKYLKYKSKYLEKKYGRQFRFRYKTDYENDSDYKQKYFKYKLKYGGTRKYNNNNFDYQQKYFKYKSKYLDIKYGGTHKLKVDYNNNFDFDYQQKYFKYKSKYLNFKKQQEGGIWDIIVKTTGDAVGAVDAAVKSVITPAATVPVTVVKSAAVAAPKPASKPVDKPPPKVAPKPVVESTGVEYMDNLNSYFENTINSTGHTKTSTKSESIINFINHFFKNGEGKNIMSRNNGNNGADEINRIIALIERNGKHNEDKGIIEEYDTTNYKDIKTILEKVILQSIGYHIVSDNRGGTWYDILIKLYDNIINNFFTLNNTKIEPTKSNSRFKMLTFFNRS